ncbi:ABC transporter permease [uncultured Rikenella sp.]|uniref:ABC transporter permease n=1 Tax=uncultured Rikenella sp. TaxID=368003 RepID=UPI002606E40C|nr:ABC transporter permease [uncultured Rikenella sp.]
MLIHHIMGNFLQLKSFWNFLKRNKLFTVINIFGFAVSLTFVVLIGLYVQDEVAVNRSQVNRDRIYRIVGSSQTNFAPPTAPDLANRYPEIERYTLTYNKYGWEVSVESENGAEPVRYIGNALMTDSSFFRIFSFPFVEGTPEQALLTKGETVLTESYARKLFGNQPALGKTIRVDGFGELVVSGVVADFDKETHFANPDFLLWLDNLSSAWGMNVMGHSGWCSVEIYFMAHRQADLPAKAADLDEYVHSNDMYWLFRHDSTNHASFEPLEEVYFSQRQSYGANRQNDSRFLTVLGATALLILAFAIINYINLSVAQSGFRAQEAATRRLLGGSRGSLFAGFILESLIICFVSFCLGLLLVQAIVPWFREVMECDTSLADSFTAGNVALALGGVVVIGVISGLVPAYVLTRFKPIDVVRGTFRRQTKMVYSKILIAFQYCITIALIGCTITVIRQTNFMMKTDLGYRHDYLLTCDNMTENAAERAAVRSQLMAIPGVEQVAFVAGTPADGGNNNSARDKEGRQHSFQMFVGDSTYMEMMGFEVLHRTGVVSDRGVWINETAWKRLELPDDATECFDPGQRDTPAPLLGMVRDFHTTDLGKPIGEAMIRQLPEDQFYPWSILIRVSPADPFGAMNRVRDWYNGYKGGQLFMGSFLDDQIQRQYESQERTAQILTYLSFVAIVISALGMLAMATYFMRQRAQEVAIRKVFGATNGQVLTRLMTSFLRLVVVAFVLAVPVIWYVMSEWLSGYAYRIPLSWTIFALSGLAAFAIAFFTVLWQSLKATRANPVVAIRD